MSEDEHNYDADTIRAMLEVSGDAFDFEEVGKKLAYHEPVMFLKMLKMSPKDTFTSKNFSGLTKIQAIKLVRNETGMGLKEAKDFVEDLGGYEHNGQTIPSTKSKSLFGEGSN